MATMVKLQTMIIAVLCVVIVALAAVLFVVYQRPVAPIVSSSAKSEPSATTRTPAIPSSSPELDRYLQNAPASGDPVAAQIARRMQEKKMVRLKELQAKFKEISADGKTPDLAELDQLLGELIEVQGTSMAGGVNLNTLRENLKVALEIQALAKEMDAESKKPEPDQNRLLEIMKKIQEMQKELNPNVMAVGAAKSMPAPATVNTQNNQQKATDTQKDQKGK